MPAVRRRDFVTELNAIDRRVSSGPPARHRQRYDALEPFECDLYDANRFNFECICGGLGVFFTNSAGGHWRETIDALARIGALRAHSILVKACSFFPAGAPAAAANRFWKQASDPVLQDKLNSLGAEIDDTEIMSAMKAYWKRNSRRPRSGIPRGNG